jgi:hypothetical protein
LSSGGGAGQADAGRLFPFQIAAVANAELENIFYLLKCWRNRTKVDDLMARVMDEEEVSHGH